MLQVYQDGTVLREEYPGGRTALGIFWAIVQPLASAGFLVVGLSIFFGEDIVDWTPVTSALFPFLRATNDMFWFPQGMFMTFYGFFGFFVFGPLQLWIQTQNPGKGLTEFNRNTQRITKIVDNEVLDEIKFSDVQKVKFRWSSGQFLGQREIILEKKDGSEFFWQDVEAEQTTRAVMERRAAILSEFLDVDLEIED